MTDTIKISRELLPCPFCGGTPEVTLDFRGIEYGFRLMHRCEVIGAIAFHLHSEQSIIERWNRRAQPPEQPGAGEREAAFSDCIQSLHDEMLNKYHGQKPEDMHPVTRREYDRDMAEIAEYRAALSSASKGGEA